MALLMAASSRKLPRRNRKPRRRALNPTMTTQARAVSPMGSHGDPGRAAGRNAPVVGAVVDTVRVAVAAPEVVTFTGLVDPKLKVGRC